VLRPLVLYVRVQNNFLVTVNRKQRVYEQGKKLRTQTLSVVGEIANLYPYFRNTAAFVAVIHLTDGFAVQLDNMAAVGIVRVGDKLFAYILRLLTRSVWKPRVRHDFSVVPPKAELLRVRGHSVPNR
jgi:sterol desaturase/sphingolipid hydroxylase (fatty acid hydroxylase superfamily)